MQILTFSEFIRGQSASCNNKTGTAGAWREKKETKTNGALCLIVTQPLTPPSVLFSVKKGGKGANLEGEDGKKGKKYCDR